MAHADNDIRECEDKLVLLRADRDAENAKLSTPVPAGLPHDWVPLLYRRGQADWIIVAWHDPSYRLSAYRSPDGLPIALPSAATNGFTP